MTVFGGQRREGDLLFARVQPLRNHDGPILHVFVNGGDDVRGAGGITVGSLSVTNRRPISESRTRRPSVCNVSVVAAENAAGEPPRETESV